tara:strand:- start:1624 stop:2364 length:741 start_codon:yes stop_codon:yes gene_type:complete
MKYAIIICPDLAGQNIKKFLDEYSVKYHEVNNKCCYLEHVDQEIDADIFIIATTHTSAKGVPALTVHYPGNWNANDLGGDERVLNVTPASLARAMFLKLKDLYDGDVSFEADHHGPRVDKPIVFIEIGSSEEAWKDPKHGKIIAEVLRDVVGKEKKCKTVIGLGGGHYPHEFNKLLERSEYAISHICSKYQLEYLDEEMLRQAIEKSVEKVEFAVLDWKGMGKEKARVLELLEKLGLDYKKSKDLF